MANELDLYSGGGGELAPYSQPLAPAPDIGNTQLSNREADEYTRYTSGGQAVFGVALPAGVTAEQVRQGFQQLGNVFVADFMQLGHNVSQTQKCVSWFLDAITNPPAQQRKRHAYNLYEHSNDPTFQAFANYAHDNHFSAKLISDACWWVSEAAKRLTKIGSKPNAREGNPTASASGRPDDLDDATYNQLYDYNQKMKPYTEGKLRERWGNAYEANRRMVDDYLQSLSAAEKNHFDRFLNNGLHALNDPTVIIGLHGQAIGIHNIPKSGAALADEINLMHDVIKNHRKQWLADERMQSRYRELIRIRDGG